MKLATLSEHEIIITLIALALLLLAAFVCGSYISSHAWKYSFFRNV